MFYYFYHMAHLKSLYTSFLSIPVPFKLVFAVLFASRHLLYELTRDVAPAFAKPCWQVTSTRRSWQTSIFETSRDAAREDGRKRDEMEIKAALSL